MKEIYKITSERNGAKDGTRLFCLQFDEPISYNSKEELTKKIEELAESQGGLDQPVNPGSSITKDYLYRFPKLVEKVDERTFWVEYQEIFL